MRNSHLVVLITTIACIFLNYADLVAGECARPCVRKEVHDLTPVEFKTFLNAFRKLADTRLNMKSTKSILDHFAAIHNEQSEVVHGGPAFFSW